MIEIHDLLQTMDGPTIDAWCDDNANSLPEIRDFSRHSSNCWRLN